ncbi:sensor histidine kinase [Patiriisocius hiemis]|uniref:histidine kinase n=1 Tax=Patiriisocius hiemis TaxID=3075604 RepID=A0ABU2YDZ3_9FLAO|nr:HAMP domain-containing sensor histidine kinase [Constantimarinum sp. W242]MDT0556417.1 HAMP domain-containing sensor histidine kinase [Constantimarinum sp. W242]
MITKNSVNRWIYILGSVTIISLILWNTYSFFNQLKENERNKMSLWASAQQELEEYQLSDKAELSPLILKTISSNSTTPLVVYTHSQDSYTLGNFSSKDSLEIVTNNRYEEYVERFSKEYTPLEVTFQGEKLQTIYYGNSPIINKLKYYPAGLILILVLFITAIYFFYKTSKSSDQNKLWAGMAKETAHQIGTPLSSLVGWTEILKSENINPDYIAEIEKDVDRLKTITERFSKVGSVPKLEKTELIKETKEAFDYLKNRSSKLIDFKIDTPKEPLYVMLNSQLYGWTVENLVKNGIDAMKGKGTITVSISQNSKYAIVNVTDTGKGIPKSSFKKIFNPGYTTKKRGWGLGLSLAKRIIEEYHNGKIKVSSSSIGKGTTLQISLKILKE